MTTYLTTPKRMIASLVLESDRVHLSQPVAVEPLYCELSTRFVIVHDAARGVTFPCDARNLREGGAK